MESATGRLISWSIRKSMVVGNSIKKEIIIITDNIKLGLKYEDF